MISVCWERWQSRWLRFSRSEACTYRLKKSICTPSFHCKHDKVKQKPRLVFLPHTDASRVLRSEGSDCVTLCLPPAPLQRSRAAAHHCGGHRDLKDSSDPYMSDILSQQAMLLFSFSFKFPLQVQPSYPPLNLRPLSTAPQWLLCPSPAFTADSLCFTYQPQISDFLWLFCVCVSSVPSLKY